MSYISSGMLIKRIIHLALMKRIDYSKIFKNLKIILPNEINVETQLMEINNRTTTVKITMLITDILNPKVENMMLTRYEINKKIKNTDINLTEVTNNILDMSPETSEILKLMEDYYDNELL